MTTPPPPSSTTTSSSSSRYEPYPRYKDSGVEWLGKIPEGWKVKRLKFIASVRFSSVDKHALEGELPVRLCNYTDVYYNDQITDTIEFMNATASRDEVERFSLEADDVLITKDSETWDDIAVAAYVPKKIDNVLCGYHLALVRPNSDEISGKYLARGFAARGINDQFRVAATGITRFGIGNYDIVDARFCLPSLEEQHAITHFLDRETANIDSITQRARTPSQEPRFDAFGRMGRVLAEYRSAVITAAVTGKIDVRDQIEVAA